MRTTLNLPEELIQEALQATQAKNRTQVIVMALEELVRRHRLQKLKKYKGKLELDINLDVVRGRGTAC